MIGVFDSGVGGLAVTLPLRRELPNVDLVYLADAAFAPYGEHTQAEIVGRMLQVTQRFHDRGVRLLVIACNTATVNAIDELRLAFPDMTFVGIEPAIKPATAVCDRIIVLGTNSTVANERYRALVEQFATGKQFWNIGAPELVRQVEAGDLEGTDLLAAKLQPMIDDGAEAVVIGCTHFSFLIPTIQKQWPQLQLFDGAEAVVRRTVDMASKKPPTLKVGGGETEFFTTGSNRIVSFVGPPVTFQHAKLSG